MKIEEIIKNYKEFERLEQQAKEEKEKYKRIIIDYMEEEETNTLETGMFEVTYIPIISNRFDTTNFKRDFPKIYNDYLKESVSKRFRIR